MKISNGLRFATKNLMHCRINNPAFDAEILLSYVLDKSREYLLAHPEIKLTVSQNKKYQSLISRRAKDEPIAYLTQDKEFYGLNFYVDKNALIPRPESELMIEEVKKILKQDQKPIIIDVGTGSGCLAITLSKIFPAASVYATDVSLKALVVARKNARSHKVKIKFYRGNLLASLPKSLWRARASICIIANLPYLSEKYQKNIRETSLKFEPKKALWGGEDGLDYYRELFGQIRTGIRNQESGIMIFAEINPEQILGMKKIIKNNFPKAKIKTKKDLGGLERILVIKI